MYDEIDIRLAVGRPSGETPIKMTCPLHQERIGMEDDKGSLAVYRRNVHCFGCGFHIKRRYASLAFLLGEWDGRGDEDSIPVKQAVRRVKERLEEFKAGSDSLGLKRWVAPAPTMCDVEAFHQYLTRYQRGRLEEELYGKRGYTRATVERFKLGHTGTHFVIPVQDLAGGYYTLRYRSDDQVVDTYSDDYRKYTGLTGRNDPILYPLPVVQGVHRLEELWIVEGEYDAISGNQAGDVTLTITNGATNISKIVAMIERDLPELQVKHWVIATDQDAAGEKAAEDIMKELAERGASYVRARWEHGKDLTEYYANGGRRDDIKSGSRVLLVA